MIDDLISRQAAIDALTENKEMINAVLDSLTLDYNTRRNQEQRRGQINEDIETIKALQPAQRWILCSERLPEDDAEVLVYLFDRPSPYIAWVCDGCWFTEDFQVEKENYPNAWMPLPEPYMEEGEQDADVNT